MNRIHGILIRPDLQTITDVYAAVWNGCEIRKKLLLHDEAIAFRDLRTDTLVVPVFLNFDQSGERFRSDGFELFGECYYGNALIMPDEGRDSPIIAPAHVAHIIRFFRVEREPWLPAAGSSLNLSVS